MRKHTNICVIESRWEQNKNTSVRSVFELISDLHCGTHHAFEYEMANNKNGFIETIKRQLDNKLINYIIIETHGNNGNITLHNKEEITRTILRNSLIRDNNRNLIGLHFGSCSFIGDDLALFLYEGDISPWWISGYGEDVNWIDALAFEFLFFNMIISKDRENKNSIKVIEEVCGKIKNECAGLIKRLKFQVYIKNDNGEIYRLFRYDKNLR